MIIFNNVTYKYHYENFAIFKGLSFTLQNGVNTILCGTQCGKSSLCKLLCGEISPQQGNVTLDWQMDSPQDNGILWLPKNPMFFCKKSVVDNVAYPLIVRKTNKKQAKQIAMQQAVRFGLPTDVKASKLTIQQQRSLALARGLVIPRKAVLFDDFIENLSQIEELLNMFDCNVKVILTSNAHYATGHTVVIDDGKCVFEGDSQSALQIASNIDGIIKE